MKYKIKAVTIEVYEWTGNYDELDTPPWLVRAQKKNGDEIGAARIISNTLIKIVGRKGVLTAQKGDFIVKGPKGDIYPIKKEVLELLQAEQE